MERFGVKQGTGLVLLDVFAWRSVVAKAFPKLDLLRLRSKRLALIACRLCVDPNNPLFF
jgi:hypothetical protein